MVIFPDIRGGSPSKAGDGDHVGGERIIGMLPRAAAVGFLEGLDEVTEAGACSRKSIS